MSNTLETTILLRAMTTTIIGAALANAAVTDFGGLLVLWQIGSALWGQRGVRAREALRFHNWPAGRVRHRRGVSISSTAIRQVALWTGTTHRNAGHHNNQRASPRLWSGRDWRRASSRVRTFAR